MYCSLINSVWSCVLFGYMNTLPPISSNQHSTVIQFMYILLNFHDPYKLVTSYSFTLCKHINSQYTAICLEKLLFYSLS